MTNKEKLKSRREKLKADIELKQNNLRKERERDARQNLYPAFEICCDRMIHICSLKIT